MEGFAAELMKTVQQLRKDGATGPGVSTGSDLNFYYLEQNAKLIYPVYYPVLATTPRVSPQYNGSVVGGTAVNWKAITDIDTASYSYPATSEGHRNANQSMITKNYTASYKYLGADDYVTWAAEKTGLGFDDLASLTRLNLLNSLLNGEERMLLFGNSGSSGNGFQLGTPVTPTGTTSATAGSLSTSTNYYVSVVALTGWGQFMGSATVGPKLPFTRPNADGSQDTINGGTSIASASSAAIGTSTFTSIAVKTTAIAGAMAYAWYVGGITQASQIFFGLSAGPSITITSQPTATVQSPVVYANNPTQTNSAGSLLTDNSANALDFDGFTTWGFAYANASPKPSYWKDYNNANLTANGDGTIAEIEAMLDYLWVNYKLQPDRFYLGGSMINGFTRAVTGVGVANNVQRFFTQTDAAGKITGGTLAQGYRSKYGFGAMANKQIDVIVHPWLPPGVIWADTFTNPYPAAGNTIPAVRRVVCLEDHFGVQWPQTTLNIPTGVYVFPTTQVYIPFSIGLLTGLGQA